VFQLADSGLRDPQRIDRLLLVIAIAVLAGSLQGYALSLAGLRRQVDPHWKRGMSFLRVGLGALQIVVADAPARLMACARYRPETGVELGHLLFAYHRAWDLALSLPGDRHLEPQGGGLGCC
jgi:hypothetical protein